MIVIRTEKESRTYNHDYYRLKFLSDGWIEITLVAENRPIEKVKAVQMGYVGASLEIIAEEN